MANGYENLNHHAKDKLIIRHGVTYISKSHLTDLLVDLGIEDQFDMAGASHINSNMGVLFMAFDVEPRLAKILSVRSQNSIMDLFK